MARPREQVRGLNVRLPAGHKGRAGECARQSYKTVTAWAIEQVLEELEKPDELFRVDNPGEPIDGPHEFLFIELPEQLYRRVCRVALTEKPAEVGRVIGRVISRRIGSPLAI